jgi:hypothetical protein
MSINLFATVLADAGGSGGVQRLPNIPPPVTTPPRTTTTNTSSLPPSVQRQIVQASTPTPAPTTVVPGFVQETKQNETRRINETITKPAVVQGMTGGSTASLPASAQAAIAAQQATSTPTVTLEQSVFDAGVIGAEPVITGTTSTRTISGREYRQPTLQEAQAAGLTYNDWTKLTMGGNTFNRNEQEKFKAFLVSPETTETVRRTVQAIDDAPGSTMSDGLNERQAPAITLEDSVFNAGVIGAETVITGTTPTRTISGLEYRQPTLQEAQAAGLTYNDWKKLTMGPNVFNRNEQEKFKAFLVTPTEAATVETTATGGTERREPLQAIDDAPGSTMSDGLRKDIVPPVEPVIETPDVETPDVKTDEVVVEDEVEVDEEVVTQDEVVTPTPTPTPSPTPTVEDISTTANNVVNELANSFDTLAFTWDRQAMEEALAQYDVDTAQAVRNAIEARNQLAVARAEALNQFYGGQYSSASKIEKFGWTGGAATDEKMRMAFLNATVNANMFNQKEMVLAGYDSELSIAREYAKANLTKLANEKYQQAQANAIGLAEVTGRYMSPEARDILSNYNIAMANPSDPRNAGVLASVNTWLESQGITPEQFGVMNEYFNKYILYGNSVGALQWDKAVERAEMKDTFRTFDGYNYSKEEWDTLTRQMERGNMVWDEEELDFVPKNRTEGGGLVITETGTVEVKGENLSINNNILTIDGLRLGEILDGKVINNGNDTGYRVDEEGNVTRVGLQREAKSSDASNLITAFNRASRKSVLNWTQGELQQIMSLDPSTLTPLRSTAGALRGYKIPDGITTKLTKEISVEQYNYLMENWWLK